MTDQSAIVPFPQRATACAHGAAADCSECKIRLVSVCAAFEHEDLDVLQAMAQSACFDAKETLFVEQDESSAAFTITEGVVRLHRDFADGRRQVIGFLLPGDFIAIEAAGHYSFSAETITPVRLCRFPRRQFTAALSPRPHVLKKLYEVSAQELIRARDHMMALGQRSARERVAWFLVEWRNRWARTELKSDTVPIPMSRQDIADYLGLTIETVSRTLSALAAEGAIAVLPHEIQFKDAKKVEQLAAA